MLNHRALLHTPSSNSMPPLSLATTPVSPRRGFTIVELLIVIIVIAILAAITTVAYNGVQQRARNAQIVSGVRAYEKTIRMYQIDQGALPNTSGCLGANYPSNQCWNGTNGTFAVNAGLDTLIAPYLPQKPTLTTRLLQITAAPDYRLGALYRYTNVNDVRIIYYLEGASQTCLNGSVGNTEMQGTQCYVQLAP